MSERKRDMSTVPYLLKKIDSLLVQIEQQRGPAEEDFYSDIRNQAYLLTEQEQADMLELLAVIEPKTGFLHGRLDSLRSLTDSERDKLSLWLQLLEALKQEDVEAAARCRRYLSEDLDSLIAQFMSIDEQSIAEAGSDQVQMIQEGHVIYPMSRINYRSAKWCLEKVIAGNRISDETDTMRRWVEAFAT